MTGSLADIGDGRNDFPGYADPADGLVSCHVVGDQSEERRQCLGATAAHPTLCRAVGPAFIKKIIMRRDLRRGI